MIKEIKEFVDMVKSDFGGFLFLAIPTIVGVLIELYL